MNDKLSKMFLTASFFCTILVVCIHYNSLYHFKTVELNDFSFFTQLYLTSGLARVAVPFFAFASGVFLFLKFDLTQEKYKNALKKRTMSLAVPYLIVATIVFIFSIFLDHYNAREYSISFNSVFYALITPQTVQLWYVRDLLFLVIISPAIYLACKKFNKFTIACAFLLWLFEIQIFPSLGKWYIISIETFFFFTLGCYFSKRLNVLENLIKKCSTSMALILTTLFAVLMLSRTIIEPQFNNWYNDNYSLQSLMLHKFGIIFGLMSVLVWSFKLNTNNILYLSKFTFFVYLYHLMPLSNFILLFWNNFVTEKNLFFVTTPTALFLSFAIAVTMNKYFTKLYQILSGGRSVN